MAYFTYFADILLGLTCSLRIHCILLYLLSFAGFTLSTVPLCLPASLFSFLNIQCIFKKKTDLLEDITEQLTMYVYLLLFASVFVSFFTAPNQHNLSRANVTGARVAFRRCPVAGRPTAPGPHPGPASVTTPNSKNNLFVRV